MFLVNIGKRKRGWCGHWAQDIGARLKELNLKTLVLHWGVAYDHTSSENNCLVVTARNQPFQDGIILDGWRRAGRLFWCPVIKDDEYEMEQHYGHSGITMWRENMEWSAWLQEAETAKPRRKQCRAARLFVKPRHTAGRFAFGASMIFSGFPDSSCNDARLPCSAPPRRMQLCGH